MTRRAYPPLPCTGCGKLVEIVGKNAQACARRGRAYCGDDCKRTVVGRASAESLARTSRLYASARMRANNPMHRGDARERMTATLRLIGHQPKVRGGNGHGMTEPQRLLLDALGYPWEPEFIFATRMGRGSIYPNHYKLDLAHQPLEINVEVDGSSHTSLERQEQDQRRDALLRRRTWTVLRLRNEEITRDLAGCVARVRELEARVFAEVLNAPYPAEAQL